ncbi:MAG: phosphate acyltransferase, partial [Sphingopyxis sp.]|nr:phosphate acyltransferase [Sphingopyxis sp.]
MTRPRIAIDAMGGDVGVRVMVAGAALAAARHPPLTFVLVGDHVRIERG